MPKYRKKPVEIEAIQWHEKTMTIHDVLNHFGGLTGMKATSISRPVGRMLIETEKETIPVLNGDWIVQDENGDMHSIPPDIFAATYERVTNNG